MRRVAPVAPQDDSRNGQGEVRNQLEISKDLMKRSHGLALLVGIKTRADKANSD